jgi:hypothetical protein
MSITSEAEKDRQELAQLKEKLCYAKAALAVEKERAAVRNRTDPLAGIFSPEYFNKPYHTKHGTFAIKEHPLFAMEAMKAAMAMPRSATTALNTGPFSGKEYGELMRAMDSTFFNHHNISKPNINQERGYEATEKKEPTMNKIAIVSTPLKTIELSAHAYYNKDKEIVVRQTPITTADPFHYKLAPVKGKITADNAVVTPTPVPYRHDLVPAPYQTLEVQELQPGCIVFLNVGYAFVISVTASTTHPQDVVVRYITPEGAIQVETIAQETYVSVVLSFDDSIYGSPAFKKFVFEDVLRPMNVISNGNTNRALAVYRIVDKVEFLGEKRTTDLLNVELAAACYRTWD